MPMTSASFLFGFGLSLCYCSVVAATATPEVVFSWKQINDGDSGVCTNNDVVVKNNAVTGLKYYNGTYFATVPRWRKGVPSTLNTITAEGKLRAWPDCASQDEAGLGNPDKIQYVQSMEIDPVQGLMWVLDVGRTNWWATGCVANTTGCSGSGTPSNAVPPKLRIYNITNKSQVGTDFTFPDVVAPHNSSFLNDLVLDLVNDVAYISDAAGINPDGSKGGIVVYKRKTGEARRFYGASTAPSAPFASVNFKAATSPTGDASYPDGIIATGTATDGIALTPDLCRVHYAPMGSNHQYSIPTSALLDFGKNVTEYLTELNTVVTDHGRRPGGIHDGMTFSTNGLLYFGGIRTGALYSWNVALPLSTATMVAQSDETLGWIDTFAFNDATEELLFTTNRLEKFFQPSYNPSDVNFRVMKLPGQGDPPQKAHSTPI